MCNTMYEDLKARYPQYGATDKILAFSNFLHPGLKGSILFKIGLYNTTLELLRLEEEGTPEEVGLDQAMALDSDDEEQLFEKVRVIILIFTRCRSNQQYNTRKISGNKY